MGSSKANCKDIVDLSKCVNLHGDNQADRLNNLEALTRNNIQYLNERNANCDKIAEQLKQLKELMHTLTSTSILILGNLNEEYRNILNRVEELHRPAIQRICQVKLDNQEYFFDQFSENLKIK